ISLLGPAKCVLNGAHAEGFAYDKVRALLFYLAVEGDRPHRRDSLAGLLWPEQGEPAARHSLSQALWNLRAAIDERQAEPPAILVGRDMIQFNRAADQALDVADFIELVDASDAHLHDDPRMCWPCARRREQAIDLYRGDFLADFSVTDSSAFEEWRLVKREFLLRRVTQALEHVIVFHRQRGDLQRATEFARRWTSIDPLDETAQRALIAALSDCGDRAGALRQFERCREILAAELGVEPDAETEALYQSILHGDQMTDAAPSDRPRSGHTRHRIVAPPTKLIGRENELAQLARLLGDPTHRLITLAGPGGIGKSRLALALAEQEGKRYADGACFIPLAGLTSAALLAPTMADSLSLSFFGRDDPKSQLIAYLRSRELLLILDNFEHLLEGTDLIPEILAEAPALQIIATSRERLNLYGEQVFHLSGLRVPPMYVSQELEQYSAVQLFLYRARRADPNMAFSADDHDQMARICTLVGGLPLAIELAAAWAPVLSCAEIAREIESNLDFLRTELRDIPERHRSVRAAFDHSWQLIDDREREVFARLSLFRGGFTRAAAVTVAGADLPTLASLVAKSFITRDASGRYGIHELLRQYGEDALRDAGEQYACTRQAHCHYFVDFLDRCETQLKGSGQEAALREIVPEIENLRLAWDWAVEHRASHELGICCRAVWLFFEITGRFEEWNTLFEDAIKALESETGAEPEIALARLLIRHGACNVRLGVFEGARHALDRSISILRQYDVPNELAFALNLAAVVAHMNDAFDQEQNLLRESLTLFQQAGDRWGTAYSLNDLGLVTHLLGNAEEAGRLLVESLEIASTNGDKRGMAFALNNLGTIAYQSGEYDASQRWHQQSLLTRQAIGNPWGIATSLTQLGMVARAQGLHAQAWRWFVEALRIASELHTIPIAIDVLVEIAQLYALEERNAEAIAIAELILTHRSSGSSALGLATKLQSELAGREPTVSSDVRYIVTSPTLDTLIDTILREHATSADVGSTPAARV
ncbi:MAG TPA: BTAD domain-containing putative transcriptional regulator, partial [Nitrolancea sp.]|nr:BTAD domain-containing putative transcriptional regulator [Nitrolancea sp.]